MTQRHVRLNLLQCNVFRQLRRAQVNHRARRVTPKWKTQMNIRTLSVIAFVTAALSSPVLAQEVNGTAARKPIHALRHYRSTYNQVQGPAFVAPRLGAYGDPEGMVDRSRPGGYDPDFRPSGS